MLLHEIFNQEKSEARWTDELQALITKHGLSRFDGNQATVITSDDRKHVYRIWARDEGYEEWIETALKMQSNPHIVKVLGKVRAIETRFKNLPKDVKLKFVKLEKLTPIEDEVIAEAITLMDSVVRQDRSTLSADDLITKAAHPDNAKANFIEEVSKEAIDWMQSNKEFVELFLKLAKLGYNDMNIENLMMRGETVVIVDPLSDN